MKKEVAIKKTIVEDIGQKIGQHTLKHDTMRVMGYPVVYRLPLPVGDYVLADEKVLDVIHRKEKRGIPVKKLDFAGAYNLAVDTKKDIQELIGDICGKQHARFRDECILAQNLGVDLLILIENTDSVKDYDDLKRWVNPRLKHSKGATSGRTLVKAMETMREKYGVRFAFTTPEAAGRAIVDWLTIDEYEMIPVETLQYLFGGDFK